jgi:hypothetical protein
MKPKKLRKKIYNALYIELDGAGITLSAFEKYKTIRVDHFGSYGHSYIFNWSDDGYYLGNMVTSDGQYSSVPSVKITSTDDARAFSYAHLALHDLRPV